MMTFYLRLAPAARCQLPATAEALFCSAFRVMGLGLSLRLFDLEKLCFALQFESWQNHSISSGYQHTLRVYASKQPLSPVVDRIRKRF